MRQRVLRTILLVDAFLEPGGTLVEYGQELGGELLEELEGNGLVDVPKPGLPFVALRYLPVGPLAGQVDAEAGDDRGLVLKAHCGQVQAVGGHEVGGLGEVLAGPDEVATADDVRVRVIDAHVEAERLEEDVLVHDEVGRLLEVLLRADVQRLVLVVLHEAELRHFDDVLELPRLLLHLAREEERRRRHVVPVEVGEGVKDEEAVHVDHGRVDAQLVHVEPLPHVLDQVGRLLPARELLGRVIAAPPRG